MTQSRTFPRRRFAVTSSTDRRKFLVVALAATIVGRPVALCAQQKGMGDKKGKGKDKDNEVQIEGTIRQISPQGLYVEGDDRVRYLVGVLGASQVTLQGDVDPAFLVPGAFVEFEVELDRSGNPTQEIKSVTFVDASPLNPGGLFQTTLPNSEGGEEDRASFLVRGRVTSARTGQLVVQTGERNVSVKTGERLSLTCKLDGLNFASAGDSIRGNVEYVPQPNTGITHVVGRKLTIRAAKPLKPAAAKSTMSKAGSGKSSTAPSDFFKP